MIDDDLSFPDWSSHPPAPTMSFAEYEAWILGEVVPSLRAEGKMTAEYSRSDFDKNEGLMKESFRL